MKRFEKDRVLINEINFTEEIRKKTLSLLLANSIRSLDAIHLATLLIFQKNLAEKIPFFTSDQKQHQVARKLGMNSTLII